MSELIITEKENIVAIADAVRSQTGITEEMTLSEIVNAVYDIRDGSEESVLYVEQTLTEEQKAVARENIGAVGESELADELAKRGQLKPEFANSVDECTDTSKLYVLPDGYIYAYMLIEENTESETTSGNMLFSGIDTDGSLYNGTGWKEDYRLNSSGVESSYSGMDVTGYIPIKVGDTITITGAVAGGNTSYFHYYDSSFTWISKADGDKTSGTSPNNTYTVTNESAAYYRMTAVLDDASIVITSTEISTSAGYGWASTGHAFVPTDYEDRIISAEEAVAELETSVDDLETSIEDHEERIANVESGTAKMTDYAKTEAESVIDRIIAAQGNRTFTFAAITDMHYGNGSYTDGVDNACKALKYIDSRIKLDAVAVLGDYTDGMSTTNYDGAISDLKAINSILDGLRFAPNMRMQGNHDFFESHSPIISRYIQAYSDDVVWGDRLGGYFYRDFDSYKLRVIVVNGNEIYGDSLYCSDEQYNWFINSLDLSAKETAEDWQILILSHLPLDWFAYNNAYVFWQILNAYQTGGNWSNKAGTITCNFANKNSAKIIGNIHGHIHNFLVKNLTAGQPNATEETIDVLRIATPEACYGRPNSYNGTWDYNPFGEETSYSKTQGTAEDTAFCVYCIDLDTHTIKAICYGAGYDREISY